jgi:plasmid maintenance system antidote protein VapI
MVGLFGLKTDTLMRMQASFDIAQTRKREKQIRVRRVVVRRVLARSILAA